MAFGVRDKAAVTLEVGVVRSCVAAAGVNVIAIAQGSSEYNISFVIEATATKNAVEAVHQEFRLHERSLVHPEVN